MNRLKFLIFSLLLTIGFGAKAQMEGGAHKFTDGKITFTLKLSKSGETIESATIVKDGKTLSGKGEFRAEYGFEWYEFQTDDCNYNFELPVDALILEEFDCKNGQKSKKYTLKPIIKP
jgi:hypothetical protein